MAIADKSDILTFMGPDDNLMCFSSSEHIKNSPMLISELNPPEDASKCNVIQGRLFVDFKTSAA